VNLKRLWKDIRDIILPLRCLACTEIINSPVERLLCSSCQEKIVLIFAPFCPICGLPFPNSPAGSHICSNCLENEPFYTKARAVVSFETIMMDAIHKFKYGRSIPTGEALSLFMAAFPFPDFDFTQYDLLIPVPLHIKKLRERGFNQSLLLAKALGKKYKLSVDFSSLKRSKFTLSQTGLSKSARGKNIKGAFVVKDQEKVSGKDIILIDDVFTTGATINECAQTLLKAGAHNVAALTLARVLQDHPSA